MRRSLRIRSVLLWVLGIPLGLAMVFYTADESFTVLRVAENWAYDARVAALTPPSPQVEDVVVVAIVPETLEGVPYRSPLDRGVLRDVLEALAGRGVRAIGLDVLFTQPTEPEKDAALREVMLDLEVPLVVATAGAAEGLDARQLAFMREYLRGVSTGLAIAYKDIADGVVRTVLLRAFEDGREQLGFAAAIAGKLGARLPPGEELAVAYRGRPHPAVPSFVQYPAHLVATLPEGLLAGKVVLIGADLNFTDRHRTPLSGAPGTPDPYMPGVLVHAHTLSQLMEGREAAQMDDPERFGVLLVAAAAGVGIASVSVSPVAIFAATITLIVAGWIGAFLAYHVGWPLVPLVSPTLAFVSGVMLTFGVRWRRAQADRTFIQNAFAKYVSPAVVHQLIDDPGLLKVGGESRDITFLFTDVTDYTALAERTPPEALVALMNEYFDGALRIVLAHDGTIDRLLGDSLVVMFNAPTHQPDHPERAVRCAVALDAYFREFERTPAARRVELGPTRIGINSGPAVVGNYGGPAHFEYSATGTTTNIASRLEGANKYLGTRVCVSGESAARVPGVRFRPIGRLVLKGRTEELEVFEPVADHLADQAPLDEYLAAFGLLDEDHDRAKAAFDDLARRYPADGLVQMHRERLNAWESGSLIVLTEK